MANSSLTAPLPAERARGALPRKVPSAPASLAPEYDIVRFALQPNPRFLKDLAQYPDDPTRQPAVRAGVVRGSLEDELFLVGKYIKPNLRLEMFTVEHGQLLADGTVDPSFSHFGLAWYQSEIEANERGILSATLRAVLLDQFLGFDAAPSLAPTGTFHFGLWFSDPADVAAVEVDQPAPLGGKRRGGPLAMMSVPVAATGMGPLCSQPSIWLSLTRCLP